MLLGEVAAHARRAHGLRRPVVRGVPLHRPARGRLAFDAVPLRDRAHDLEAMAAALTPETRLVIVCNPNNPTGSYVDPGALRAFLERVPAQTRWSCSTRRTSSSSPTPATRTPCPGWSEYPNLVDSAHLLEDLRPGRPAGGLRHRGPPAGRGVDKVRQPFNVNALAQVAACEALRHPDRVRGGATTWPASGNASGSRSRAWASPASPARPTSSSFDVEGLPVPGKEVPQALLERGVMTRSGYAMDCPGWIRVTIGSTEENDLFLAELRRDQAKGRTHERREAAAPT